MEAVFPSSRKRRNKTYIRYSSCADPVKCEVRFVFSKQTEYMFSQLVMVLTRQRITFFQHFLILAKALIIYLNHELLSIILSNKLNYILTF